ncbi:MAG: hypothetical protein HQL22_12805 [Candidatus Omnitrophica bacterium]|nr:hypothetical protein [Candidatus Omnitrophota bacterium]
MMQCQPGVELLIVTCTYHRPYRLSFINECIKVLSLVPDVRWIVVEDGHDIDAQVKVLLDKSGISYVYLSVYSRNFGNAQKNLALTYIRDNKLKGIVYIADDDNRYDVRLFGEIRKTRRVSAFPVGNLGPNGIERPIVKDGKVVGWDADWLSRKFPIDQGGYAINAELLASLKDPLWSHVRYAGETEFLEKLIRSTDELEVLCSECRECYVWHNDLKTVWFLGKIVLKIKVLTRRLLRIQIRMS